MGNKIEKLTPEQEAKMPEYVEKWIKVGASTTQCSEEQAEAIVRDFRELIDLNADVPLIFAENPIEAWVICCLSKQEVPFEKLTETMRSVFAGNKDYVIPQASMPLNNISSCSTFGFYDYMLEVVGVKFTDALQERYNIWKRTSNLWAIYPLADLTVVCKKPLEVHLNENNTLHRDGGPALVFGGEGNLVIYALNGAVVPERQINPQH